jgi:hypothetical protein
MGEDGRRCNGAQSAPQPNPLQSQGIYPLKNMLGGKIMKKSRQMRKEKYGSSLR